MSTNHSHHPADTTDLVASALTVHTQVIASRSIGKGQPLLLCLRLRGVMDVWDLAVLEALAETFTVITFDSRGLDQWTGTPSDDRAALARDAKELADALGLDKVFMARYPERTSHTILIGTVPPGAQPSQAEPIFLPTACRHLLVSLIWSAQVVASWISRLQHEHQTRQCWPTRPKHKRARMEFFTVKALEEKRTGSSFIT